MYQWSRSQSVGLAGNGYQHSIGDHRSLAGQSDRPIGTLLIRPEHRRPAAVWRLILSNRNGKDPMTSSHPLIELNGLSKPLYTRTSPCRSSGEFQLPCRRSLRPTGSQWCRKTTLLRMISTLLKPDSGTAQIAGIDVIQEPSRVRGVSAFFHEHRSI